MQYNKGMLSNSRELKQDKLEKRNPVEHVTSLINLYHSISHRTYFSDGEKNNAHALIKKEIDGVKARLPKHFRDSIPYWLNNSDIWHSR